MLHTHNDISCIQSWTFHKRDPSQANLSGPFLLTSFSLPEHNVPENPRLAVVAQLVFAQMTIQSIIFCVANTPTYPPHLLSFKKEFGVAICTSACELLQPFGFPIPLPNLQYCHLLETPSMDQLNHRSLRHCLYVHLLGVKATKNFQLET